MFVISSIFRRRLTIFRCHFLCEVSGTWNRFYDIFRGCFVTCDLFFLPCCLCSWAAHIAQHLLPRFNFLCIVAPALFQRHNVCITLLVFDCRVFSVLSTEGALLTATSEIDKRQVRGRIAKVFSMFPAGFSNVQPIFFAVCQFEVPTYVLAGKLCTFRKELGWLHFSLRKSGLWLKRISMSRPLTMKVLKKLHD